MRSFGGIISGEVGDPLADQARLSIVSWSAWMKRVKVTEYVLGSFHGILVQESRIARRRKNEDCNRTVFHVRSGVDQLILFPRNTFLLGGFVIERGVAGFSLQDTFGVK